MLIDDIEMTWYQAIVSATAQAVISHLHMVDALTSHKMSRFKLLLYQ